MLAGMSLKELLPLLAPLLVLQVIVMVIGLVSLVKTERVRFMPKWAWGVIIVLLQFVGPIAFFIFGRERDDM